eukprot:TRINITY_DN36379_c0_g1_i1.p1 TRINITY_DN36379_c0_g1~~TRINITY_DN36379_c0_g1_i1.p1  ORF type:complete len:146 (+),score=11.25 TRINITY_DN36379_c0_g1_i1:139-576(+)
MATVVLPDAFGAVMLVVVAAIFLHQWMGVQVGMARKKFGVPYPLMYAQESNKHAREFNCVQRGHQNSLEALPQFFVLLLLAGLQYPWTATIAGGVYVVSRYFYFTGYATGNPDGRYRGMGWALGMLVLIGCNVAFALRLLGVIKG